MLELFSPTAGPPIVSTLVWIFLPSLLGAIVTLFVARRTRLVGYVAVGALAVETLAAVCHGIALFRTPGRRLVQHLWPLVQVGRLDASLDLSLDPLAFVFTCLVTTKCASACAATGARCVMQST